MSTPAEIMSSFYRAIETGRHGDDLADFLAPDVRTIERPNALVPSGRESDRASMLAASTAGARMLSSQRYDVRSLDELGELVAARIAWSGVVAADVGPLRPGLNRRCRGRSRAPPARPTRSRWASAAPAVGA